MQWFASVTYAMRDVGSAIVSSLVIFRGTSGPFIDAMTSYDRAFTACFYISLIFLLFVYILGLTMAVLNSAYREVRKEMFFNASAEDQDYQMLDFMLLRLKKYLKISKEKPVRLTTLKHTLQALYFPLICNVVMFCILMYVIRKPSAQ